MSALWFVGNADPWAQGGFTGPDPVTLGSSGWTWDLEFETSLSQWTYARSTLNSFTNIGGGTMWVLSGIVAYTTRDAKGIDKPHLVGRKDPDGLVDFINDVGVVNVTFGWTIEGDDICQGKINMEVWVSG